MSKTTSTSSTTSRRAHHGASGGGELEAFHPLHPYLSPQQRDDAFVTAIESAGGSVSEYGRSVADRALLVGRLPILGGDDVNGDVGEVNHTEKDDAPARVLLTANIHGSEYVSSALALHLARRLRNPSANNGHDDDKLSDLRSSAEVWIAPCLNPDGYATTWDQGGKAPGAMMRTNENGVDLNRNFPIPPKMTRSRLPGQGSKTHGDATYIGSGELSEPETQALSRLLERVSFVASANVHSFMGTTIPPRVQSRSAYRGYQTLSRAFARGQKRDRYFRLQSRFFDGYTGELEDHQHHVHRTWAMTVECFPAGASFRQHLRAPSLFWRFNPRDVERWIENDVTGVVAFFLAAIAMGPVVDV